MRRNVGVRGDGGMGGGGKHKMAGEAGAGRRKEEERAGAAWRGEVN